MSSNPPPALFAEIKFMRLKWSLLRPVSEIQVMSIEEDAPVGAPLFGTGSQPDHPLASQTATNPPRHHMVVTLDPVESWEYWQDAEAMEDRPLPFVIDNEDGAMITIGHFVTQVHAYASSIKTVIYDCLGVPQLERMSNFIMPPASVRGPRLQPKPTSHSPSAWMTPSTGLIQRPTGRRWLIG